MEELLDAIARHPFVSIGVGAYVYGLVTLSAAAVREILEKTITTVHWARATKEVFVAATTAKAKEDA